MDNQEQIIDQICNGGLLPLFYHDDIEICKKVVKALFDGGVRCIEFTNRGKNSLINFKQLIEIKSQFPGLLLGIGTIKTGEQAASFIEAGADFLVSPIFDNEIADIAYMNKMAWIPGCMTPTEVHVAQQAGCKLVKLFPGNVLGPGYVEAIMPLFSGMRFVVTGGVDITEDSLTKWMKSGIVGVGLGSKLITNTILANNEYDQLSTNTASVVRIMNEIKQSK
ncbi:MAG: bifunctional 4-hydroxy-2-oxoglutarate aldolase/2-dehydro-3-deoxy-phosphogluconate aldolase [Sphingobacteriia bacterium]